MLKTHSPSASCTSAGQQEEVQLPQLQSHRDAKSLYGSKAKGSQVNFLGSEEAALAGDLIRAWKSLREGWKLHRKLRTTL